MLSLLSKFIIVYTAAMFMTQNLSFQGGCMGGNENFLRHNLINLLQVSQLSLLWHQDNNGPPGKTSFIS